MMRVTPTCIYLYISTAHFLWEEKTEEKDMELGDITVTFILAFFVYDMHAYSAVIVVYLLPIDAVRQ